MLRSGSSRFFVLAGVAAVLWGPAGCNEEVVSSKVRKPDHVLLVTFDTTRADFLSCYGYPRPTTPTIDSIAREGTRFAHCYTTAPITLPAHATLMTGLYPFQHKLRDNGAGVLDDKAVTLAELFRDAGYRTGAFIGAYVLHSRYGLGQGFEVYSDEFRGTGAHMHDGTEFAERRADAVTDAALTWLSQNDDRPAFLWIHYFDPHAPYDSPGAPPGLDLPEAYAAEIAFADRHFARLVQKFEGLARAQSRDVLTIVTADHGEGLNEHEEETHGLFLYNTTVRVPLIVKGRGVAAGRVVDEPVSLTDLFPTVVSRFGFALPYEVPGKVLLTNGTASARPHYIETHVPFHKYGWSPLEGIVAGREKFINAPQAELFDLAADPGERSDLSGKNSTRVSELADVLAEMKRGTAGTPVFSAGELETDEASLKKLRSLGYVSGTTAAPEAGGSLPDPKAMNPVRKKLEEAEALLSRGDVAGATLLGEVIEADPNNFKALTTLKIALTNPTLRATLLPLATARAARPLPAPLDVDLLRSAGLALCLEGKALEGLATLEQAARIEPDAPAIHVARARCLETAGRPDDAAIAWREALLKSPVLRLEPDEWEALAGFSIRLSEQGNLPRARELMERAAQLPAVAGAAHYQLAMFSRQVGDVTAVTSHLEKAARARPTSIPAIEELAVLHIRDGRYAEAKRMLTEGLKAAPERSVARLKLANSLAMLLATCPDDSVRDGKTALELSKAINEQTGSSQPGLLSTLAAAHAETGNFPAAIETATKALQLIGEQQSPFRGMLNKQLEEFRAGRPYRSKANR